MVIKNAKEFRDEERLTNGTLIGGGIWKSEFYVFPNKNVSEKQEETTSC